MPLPQANLDTRRFDDLVAEMRALIPRYAPEWTNHNPSDPGITLVELLAWVTEATLYRINRVPEATSLEFAKLLLGHVEEEEWRKQPLDRRIGHIYGRYLRGWRRDRCQETIGGALSDTPSRSLTSPIAPSLRRISRARRSALGTEMSLV